MLLSFLLTLLCVPYGYFIFRSIQKQSRHSKQANLEMDQDFIDTLKTYRISSYEVVMETVRRDVGNKLPCQVHRILFDDKGQYYFYFYNSGHPGILKQISEERALLAAGTKGQVKM